MANYKKVKAEIDIEGHAMRLLFAVVDGLNLELTQVYEKDSNKFFIYEYTDPIGKTGRPSEKYGTKLTMPSEQLFSEIAKNIFNVRPNESNKSKAETATAKADMGINADQHERHSQTEQSSLFA